MPTRSMPCRRASLSAANRSAGRSSYRAACEPVDEFSSFIATSTSFASPSTRPSIAPQHSLGYAARACATISCQGSLATRIILIFVPKMFAQILVGAVAQDRDDEAALPARRQLPADLPRRPHVGARGNPHQQPLAARELFDHTVPVLCLDPQVTIGDGRVVNSRH